MDLLSPKHAAILEALRGLIPLVYVQTDEPDALIPLLVPNEKRLRNIGPFATTDPNGPEVRMHGDPSRTQKTEWQTCPDWFKPHDPTSIVHLITTCDPKDKIAFGVVKIESGQFLGSGPVMDDIIALCDKRLKDVRWIATLFFVGSLPPTAAVPEHLRDLFYPISVVVPPSTAVDTRERRHPASPEDLEALFADALRSLTPYDKPLPDVTMPPERLRLLEGLTKGEVQSIMHLSLVRWGMGWKQARSETEPFYDKALDPNVIDLYRNRWARVP